MDVISNWIAAFLTIGITTLVWKDQPYSKLTEYIFLGVTSANLIVMAWLNIQNIAIAKINSGNLIYIFPIFLGILSYARYSKKYFWLYRYSIALIVGVGIGTSMRGEIGANIVDQIKDSFYQLIVPGDFIGSFNNSISLAIVATCLLYFIFTIKAMRSPTAQRLSVLGRYAMMAAFGYTFANSLGTRIEQYAGRISFLVLEWLGLG